MIVYNIKTGVKKECNTVLLSDDMDRLIECPECGKTFKFGDGYTDTDWFNEDTIWKIPVCPECDEKFWREKSNEK